MDYCAYSFLKEGSNQCDYEIMTDRLASFLGLSMHYIKHIDQEEAEQLKAMEEDSEMPD